MNLRPRLPDRANSASRGLGRFRKPPPRRLQEQMRLAEAPLLLLRTKSPMVSIAGLRLFKDDVATLEPMLGRDSVGSISRHRHSFRSASGYLLGRGNRHSKLRQASAGGVGVPQIGGAGLS